MIIKNIKSCYFYNFSQLNKIIKILQSRDYDIRDIVIRDYDFSGL